MIGRTLATDARSDQRRARAKMLQYRLTPAPRLRSRRPGKPRKAPLPTDGLALLDALGRALAQNPPPRRDRPLLAELAAVGVGPGLRPSKQGLPADVLEGLKEGVEAQAAGLLSESRVAVLKRALAAGGWLTLDKRVGAYGTNYLLRAQVALLGIGANTPAEAIYPTALADSDGALLTGANRYRLVFTPGKMPPARGFWSLTLYDSDGFLVPNDAKRYSLGPTHPPLARRGDGSIVILVQRDRPTERRVNWLPAPAGGFRLNLRLYWPQAVGAERRLEAAARRTAAVRPSFFATPAEFRAWLERNHERAAELLVGFHKKASGRPSITWAESVEQALCFGWIDGMRRSLGDESVHDPLHAAQGAQHLERGQRGQGRGAEGARADAAGGPARLRGAQRGPHRDLLARAQAGRRAATGIRRAPARERRRLGVVPGAGRPATAAPPPTG